MNEPSDVRCGNCGNQWKPAKAEMAEVEGVMMEDILPKYCQECNQLLDYVGYELVPHEDCVICGDDADVRHHINYKDDITVPVCDDCHKEIHNSKEHKYKPDNSKTLEAVA